MKLNGTYAFDAPRELVWESIMDPEVLAKILPGCERLDKVSDTEYKGTLNVRVGPVQGKFTGKVLLSDLNEPEHFQMDIDGKGAAGFVKGGGDATLVEEEGKTVLTYTGKAQVGGRIAGVGQRLLDTSAKSIVRQGLESLDRLIQLRQQPVPAPIIEEAPALGEAPAAPPVSLIPDIEPPSEMEVAWGVAKDVFEEYVPEEQRPLVMGFAGALGAVILIWVLKKIVCRC